MPIISENTRSFYITFYMPVYCVIKKDAVAPQESRNAPTGT